MKRNADATVVTVAASIAAFRNEIQTLGLDILSAGRWGGMEACCKGVCSFVTVASLTELVQGTSTLFLHRMQRARRPIASSVAFSRAEQWGQCQMIMVGVP
ncbi:MAG: hypothetical protein ACKOOI_09785 [Pirellula sp.]